MVVLLFADIWNFAFWNVKNLKRKNFLIDFLDELDNFKQNLFYILQQQTQYHEIILDSWCSWKVPIAQIFGTFFTKLLCSDKEVIWRLFVLSMRTNNTRFFCAFFNIINAPFLILGRQNVISNKIRIKTWIFINTSMIFKLEFKK